LTDIIIIFTSFIINFLVYFFFSLSNLIQLGAAAAYSLEHLTAWASSACPACSKDLAISKVIHSFDIHEDPELNPNSAPEIPTDEAPIHGAVGRLAGAIAGETGILGAA